MQGTCAVRSFSCRIIFERRKNHDETTKKLDEIVKNTKLKKDIGVRYMKSWEIARDYIEEGREEGRKEGREEERKNTEAAIKRAEAAEARVKELEAMLSAKS